jgi:hypothetical protein
VVSQLLDYNHDAVCIQANSIKVKSTIYHHVAFDWEREGEHMLRYDDKFIKPEAAPGTGFTSRGKHHAPAAETAYSKVWPVFLLCSFGIELL